MGTISGEVTDFHFALISVGVSLLKERVCSSTKNFSPIGIDPIFVGLRLENKILKGKQFFPA